MLNEFCKNCILQVNYLSCTLGVYILGVVELYCGTIGLICIFQLLDLLFGEQAKEGAVEKDPHRITKILGISPKNPHIYIGL